MIAPDLRAAFAEHLDAYSNLLSVSSREWGAQVARRAVGAIVAAILAMLLLVVVIFVALLLSWPTTGDGGWWVVWWLGWRRVTWGVVVARAAVRAVITPGELLRR